MTLVPWMQQSHRCPRQDYTPPSGRLPLSFVAPLEVCIQRARWSFVPLPVAQHGKPIGVSDSEKKDNDLSRLSLKRMASVRRACRGITVVNWIHWSGRQWHCKANKWALKLFFHLSKSPLFELLRGVMLFARAVLQTPRCTRYWVEVASATN